MSASGRYYRSASGDGGSSAAYAGGRSISSQPPPQQQHQQQQASSSVRRRVDDEDVYNQYRFAPYLRNLRQLTIHDEEYHRMAYLLRASLASLSVKIISIHAINSPQQDAIFESNHIGTTTLDSWVNGTDLPEQNSIHNIITHGGRFRITDADKGAIFTVGNIGIDENNTPPGPAQFEFVHCRVAVGRSFVVDPAQVGAHGIPAGYDTMMIHKEDVPSDADPATSYLREYIVSDESRIYPDFVVNFVFDVAADRMKAVPTCEACESRPATLFCMQDNAKLCEVCDRDIHSRSAIHARHNRVMLNEMQNSVGMTLCKEHTNMPVQFFDPIAHIPVCVHCKMSGSHSTGDFASHPLVPIQEAYMASMKDVEYEQRIIEERRKNIYSQLAHIERTMDQVNSNHDRCQDQIYEIVQKVVQVLHEETQSKLSALLADESELKRQLEYFAWSENFLKYQQASVDPVAFLSVFKSHSSVMAQAPSEIVDGAAGVRPDIRVIGRLDVVIDDTNPANVMQSLLPAAAQQRDNNQSNTTVGGRPQPNVVQPQQRVLQQQQPSVNFQQQPPHRGPQGPGNSMPKYRNTNASRY